MQIIKYCMLFLIFVTSVGIGKLISKKYINRVLELKEIKNALNILKTKIKFTYEPLPEIFREMSQNLQYSIDEIFYLTSIKMEEISVKEAWCDTISKLNLNINEEDKNILKSLGKLLGRTDVEGQISEIEVVNSFIEKQIEKAEEDKNKNAKLYKTLGTVIGLAIVIILI